MTELRRLSGVGQETERDLLALGYSTIASLKNADPQVLYDQECAMKGTVVDRCQLYVYRCVIYQCSTPDPEPEKCRWWYWKDK